MKSQIELEATEVVETITGAWSSIGDKRQWQHLALTCIETAIKFFVIGDERLAEEFEIMADIAAYRGGMV